MNDTTNTLLMKKTSKKDFKVLLIYPSMFMQTGIPLALASLAGSLKANGIKVEVFTTYLYTMDGDFDQNELRADTPHSTIPVDYLEKGIEPHDPEANIFKDLKKVLKDYQPDLVGMSAVESVFARGISMTEFVKSTVDVPIIAGGVFPTLAPEIAIQEKSIDIICTGEGESALVELCQKIAAGDDYSKILGLWVKTSNGIVKNNRRLENLDTLPAPDFSVLDDGIFLRPMRGQLFRTIPLEFSRGCPYQCSFCAEPKLEKLFKNIGQSGFFRKRNMADVVEGLKFDVKEYAPEFFYFNSETFLAMSPQEFDDFIEGYKEIQLPFWIQTRPETLTMEKIQRLKDVGLMWLSIGVEHGDDKFRREVVKRSTKDEVIFEVFEMLDKCDQGASANMIIGFPFETRELVYQTMKFSRELLRINPRSRMNISVFAPFRGCELYDVSVENGFWDPSIPYISETNINKAGMLKLPDLSESEIEGLYRTFPLYVYLPDEYQPFVKLAEELTPEGNQMYEKLNSMVEGFLNGPIENLRNYKSMKETGNQLIAHMKLDEMRNIGIESISI